MTALENVDSFVGNLGKSPIRKTRVGVTQQKIKDRAYQIWEQMSKPQGQDLVIWLKAEKEILGSMS